VPKPLSDPSRDAGPPVACLVSLGCAKNTVDSERILASLVQDGFLIAERPEDADLCLVNTCGFIQDAREETATVLRDLASGRRRGRPARIVAIGCLVERAGSVPALREFLDAADATAGFAEFPRLPRFCREVLGLAPPAVRDAVGTLADFHRLPRLLSGGGHSACLKISEGCSNGCRFCTIPGIRGRQVSRPVDEILAEARSLIDSGVAEICLIGQDTTSYGHDLTGRRELAGLVRALSTLRGSVWFRLMYAFPKFIGDELLDALAADPRWCPYLDLPLQHISDAMLRAMGRGMGRDDTLRLLDRLAGRIPGLCMRTAYIVGHPGETDDDFAELLAFVREGRFLHAGVFVYSHEEGTPSASLPDRVPATVARLRRDELMRAQRGVSRAALQSWVGRTVEVIADEPVARGSAAPRHARWTGRHRGQAPEVDGVTFLAPRGGVALRPGRVVPARVLQGLDYDLVAEVTGAS